VSDNEPDAAGGLVPRILRAPGVLLTGQPSSGKSTLALALARELATTGVPCEVIDGDELRTRLPPPLGFSRADREHQFARALFVAEMLAAHGIVPLLALVAPYTAERERARRTFAAPGWVEVFLDPPVDVCIARDSRGLYRRLAGRGGRELIAREVFDVYERPTAASLRIDTARVSVEQATAAIAEELRGGRRVTMSASVGH
jgi:adenylylsulfate kinase